MNRLVLIAVTASVAGCASRPVPLVDLGGGAYEMTKRSGFSPQRSTALQAQVEAEALQVCASRGQALAMLDTRAGDPDPPDFAFATIQFRCVPR